ncbi:MAG: SUMF1/EgtB/PvdO family nonheme iron enzyme [Myxococcales bacterium]|nr:SUMF1/EgtB/PvdO family nonheme iron enzyme [Myxococcales bacterium]
MSPTPPSLIGRTIGNWRLQRQLGEGAFGSVFEAEHINIPERKAAVKLLHIHMALREDIRRRFVNEARAASRAEHENIVQVYDAGNTDDGLWYVVMEFLRGQSLAKLLQSGRLEVSRVIRIAAQIVQGLQVAHSLDIVHRDLKPDNLFLINKIARPDCVKILDFGIAKLQDSNSGTKTGTLMGTPAYMSPEQWLALANIDGRSDFYSLGVILYESLSGKLPFQATSMLAWASAHLEQKPEDIAALVALPPSLHRLVHQLLAKRREDRPQSAEQILELLRRSEDELARGGVKTLAISSREVATLVSPHRDLVSPFGDGRRLSTLGSSIGDITVPRPRISPPWTIRKTALLLFGVVMLAGLGTLFAVNQGRLGQSQQAAVALPPELAFLPAGTIEIASGQSADSMQGPAHTVNLKSFALGRFEVSVADYRSYVEYQKITGEMPWHFVDDFSTIAKLPMNMISRQEAHNYCAWRYSQSGMRGRLPTEYEWEYAARSGQSSRQFPWAGNRVDPFVANAGHRDEANAGMQPVDSLPAGRSEQGIFHLLGNAEEWTADDARAYPGSRAVVQSGAVLRGGSLATPLSELRTTRRRIVPADLKDPFVGFRCAVALSE